MTTFVPLTTYCYASLGAATALPLNPAALGGLAKGNGGVCPALISFSLPASLLPSEMVNITWNVILTDQIHVNTIAIVNASTVLSAPSSSVQIAQSAMYLCLASATNCGPYDSQSKILPYLPTEAPGNFTNGVATFFTRDVQFNMPTGAYNVYVLTTLPGLILPNTSCRVDLVSYTQLTIASPPSSSGLSTNEYVYIGIGAGVVFLGIIWLIVYIVRRHHDKTTERLLAAFAQVQLEREASAQRVNQNRGSSHHQSQRIGRGGLSRNESTNSRRHDSTKEETLITRQLSRIRLGHPDYSQPEEEETKDEHGASYFEVSPWQDSKVARETFNASSPEDPEGGYSTDVLSFNPSTINNVSTYRI
ncbi:hypothetical protein THRCLA_21000 [Thraustotheca clavata]|uniref:Uncharacterized protein n=1 Tax=Thraustotheca clavata TaxID=74557 RepID=A0A1W0A170_9STRA|nr:hypothetical protein THRCLA_21000 [Thraustotheca clavata]